MSQNTIVFCMIVILLILKYLYLVSFKTSEVPLHLCFASLKGASEISLYHGCTMLTTNLLSVLVSYYQLLVLCDILMSQHNCGSFIIYVSICHVIVKDLLVACHHKNYLGYHLPTRGRARIKLGDADTSETYL